MRVMSTPHYGYCLWTSLYFLKTCTWLLALFSTITHSTYVTLLTKLFICLTNKNGSVVQVHGPQQNVGVLNEERIREKSSNLYNYRCLFEHIPIIQWTHTHRGPISSQPPLAPPVRDQSSGKHSVSRRQHGEKRRAVCSKQQHLKHRFLLSHQCCSLNISKHILHHTTERCLYSFLMPNFVVISLGGHGSSWD